MHVYLLAGVRACTSVSVVLCVCMVYARLCAYVYVRECVHAGFLRGTIVLASVRECV